MKLITLASVGAPQDAEALYMSLWQSCVDFAAPVALLILGEGKHGGGGAMLGVCARSGVHEDCVRELIADATGGTPVGLFVEEMLTRALDLAQEHAVLSLIPHRRNLRMDDPNYWGAKFDPLGEVFTAAGKLPVGTIGGVAVVISPRRDGRARVEARAFAVSSVHHVALSVAQRFAREYATIGVVPRVSVRPQRDLQKILTPRVSRLRSRIRDPKEATAFWHPPYRTAEQGFPS